MPATPPTAPTATGGRAFCSVLAREEPMAGTAPHRRVWALVEHPGPWGRDAVLEAPWPLPGIGTALAAAAEAGGVRLVLARRPRRRGGPMTVVDATDAGARRRVVLARCGPGGWSAEREVPTAELPALDWAGLAASRTAPAGWSGTGPIWAVCTHGMRDACCARLGRPLAEAFEAAAPGAVWEISHSGGHRFAGVALALPSGLMHGRVSPADVEHLVAATRAGRVVDRLLRGEVHRPAADQVATASLREHLADDRLGSLTRVGEEWEHLAHDGRRTRWRVTLAAEEGPPRPPSCGALPESPTVLRAVSVRPC